MTNHERVLAAQKVFACTNLHKVIVAAFKALANTFKQTDHVLTVGKRFT